MAIAARRDGRSGEQTRKVTIEVGHLSRADGSGRFAYGSTGAMASFAGPIEVRLREELPDRATLEITHRPLEGIGATPSRALEQTLVSILSPLLNLSQHPRSLIQIVVQSLSTSQRTDYPEAGPSMSSRSSEQKTWPPSGAAADDADDYEGTASSSSNASPLAGMTFSSRSAAINAVTLAALNAGSIAMRAVPVAVSVAFVPAQRYGGYGNTSQSDRGADTVMVIDPTAEEEQRAVSRHGFCWAFGQGIASAEQAASPGGRMDDDEDEEMIVYQPRADNTGLGASTGQGREAELVWAESEGTFDRAQFSDAIAASRRAAETVLAQIREQLAVHLQRKA